MRTNASQTISTSLVLGFLFLALCWPLTVRAATEAEEFDRMAVQLTAIQSVVSFMAENQGVVLGASTNHIAELRAKIAAFSKQISDFTVKRDAAQKELDALLVSGGGGGGAGGGTPSTPRTETSCTLTSNQKEYKLGDTARFIWTTKNATAVSFVPDTSGKDNLAVPSGPQKLNGTVEIPVTVLGSPFITLSAVGGKTVTCKAVITVTQTEKGGKKAEYKGYFAPSNTPFITSKKETKADALANCALNTNSNPTKKVWCTWDGVVIMGVKPSTNVPPQTEKVVINAFTVNSKQITPGQTIQFAWSSNLTATDISYYDGSCSIEGLTQDNRALYVLAPKPAASGSVSYVPTESASYTLLCSADGKDGGPSATAHVGVTVDDGTPSTVGILESVSVSETTIVNNMNNQSDDQARFEIKFDVIAHDSDMFIRKTAARGTTGTAGALVTIENGQGAVVTTGTMSSVLTSTADSEGASYRVNEGETETFTVTVTFDPTTIGGSYRMQLQGITWTAGGNGGMTSTAATPAADFETGVLII